MRKVFVLMLISGMGLVYGAKPGLEYIPYRQDDIFRQIDENRDIEKTTRDSLTRVILDRQKREAEKKKEEQIRLRWNMEDVKRPSSPAVFQQIYHFDPTHQDATGTCWSFSATSLIESETARMTGKKIKLSEMHTVYYEYIEKARRYVQERGDSFLGEGSQINSALRIMDWYGIVPESVYPGRSGEYHDHSQLFEEIADYLDYVKEKNIWNEDKVLSGVKGILNYYLGEPPVQFEFAGKTWTPGDFARDFLEFRVDDYVDLMSTMQYPFNSYAVFDVPDNWWKDSSYYNIPLETWMNVLKHAVTNGYSVAIGGDISEPSLYEEKDMAVVAPVDIPPKLIDQEAREYRIYNGCTTDDHGIHIVGYTRHAGWDWYLIKDSSSDGRAGEFFGYLFYREDFIKLKMLGYTVHRDAVEKILGKF